MRCPDVTKLARSGFQRGEEDIVGPAIPRVSGCSSGMRSIGRQAPLLLALACLLLFGGGTSRAAPAVAPAALPGPPSPPSSPFVPTSANDTAALLSLKTSVAGSSNALVNWTATSDPCDPAAPWPGVGCSSGRVQSVALPGLGLSGTLPKTMDMPTLQLLDLKNNKLGGPLPDTLALRSLQKLFLSDNQLSGTLPATWATNLPALEQMELQRNRLASTMPPVWLQAAGFSEPFSAVVQPGNPLLCGAINPSANHSLLYNDGGGLQHQVITTLGSCAQDGNCGTAAVNRSATNLFDLAWGNHVSALDLEYFNPNVQQNGAPKEGTPVSLPCYPSNAPTFFGSDAAYRKATWQSSTDGQRTSYLPVSGNRTPQGPADCSITVEGPAFWMVDLQVSTKILAVLVRGAEQQMQGVDIHIGDTPNPTSGSLCTSGESFNPYEGKIIGCQRILTGRYLSITAQTKIGLCVVEVYPLVGNAALGKSTSGSAGTADSMQVAQVVNGNTANTACSTVVSGPNLAAWVTVDLGYEANVETVVVQNGYSNFNNDLYVRLGNTPVVNGDENPVCSQALTLEPRDTLPIQCVGRGRYVTLYRQLAQSSEMYVCQIFVFLSAGPSKFVLAPPMPPMPPAYPPPAPRPPPVGPTLDVTTSTRVMSVTLELQGRNLVPITQGLQDSIVLAAASVWVGQEGMTNVSALDFRQISGGGGGGSGGSGSSTRRLAGAVGSLAPSAAAPVPAAGVLGRLLLQDKNGSGSGSGSSWSRVQVQLRVDVLAGFAPDAAGLIVETAANGSLSEALDAQGLAGVRTSVSAVQTLNVPVPSPPAPPPPSNSGSGSSSVPIGAIVGGVAGGVVVLAAVAALLFYRQKRRRQRLANLPGKGGLDEGADSPKVGYMEQGRANPILGLPKPGDVARGYSVAVAPARTSGELGSGQLRLDTEPMTKGPPPDIISFLSDDVASDHSAFMRDSPGAAGLQGRAAAVQGEAAGAVAWAGAVAGTSAATATATATTPLQKQKSVASRLDSGVSELWTVDLKELDIQKQIGEGSFGKVYLAKWRETTVAVKVLGNMGTGAAPGLDDEFPDATAAKTHPLYESLQKEAAMMASLRHPSIVMYLGVCLDPPAVVTEYCARGSLNDVLKRARASPLLASQLDWARRLNMALDAAKGMLYLHSCSPPIIHRDLKSANLLVDKHWRVRVCDFNLSRVMEDTAVLSSVAATNPRWLAPEILSGKGYTFASDVYSFGICMWELLTWQVPYHEYGPWQVVAMVTENAKRPEVPVHEELPTGTFSGEAEYLALMHECWAQDPASRPTFAAIISRLRRMLALEASIRRSESPTKSVRSGYSGTLSGGGGGDETPGTRSRLGSLNAHSELLATPDLRTSVGGEYDSSDLALSGSPPVLGGTPSAPSGRPPRYYTGASGGGAAVRQLSSIASGNLDAAADAAAAAEAAGAAGSSQQRPMPG